MSFSMMNEKLEWTEKLGDAFLGQQKDVMVSVQRSPTEGAGSQEISRPPRNRR